MYVRTYVPTSVPICTYVCIMSTCMYVPATVNHEAYSPDPKRRTDEGGEGAVLLAPGRLSARRREPPPPPPFPPSIPLPPGLTHTIPSKANLTNER